MSTLLCFALKEEAAPFRKIAAGKAGVSILLTGIGCRNAEKSLRKFLNSRRSRGDETQIKKESETPHAVSYEPDMVLTCGFAGGLNPDLKLGDVVFEISRRRGDESQIKEKSETPHVVSYEKLIAAGAKAGKIFLRRPHRHDRRRKEKIARGNRRGRGGNGIGGDSRRLPRARNSLRHCPRDFRHGQRRFAAGFQRARQSRTRIWITANCFWPLPNRREKSAR